MILWTDEGETVARSYVCTSTTCQEMGGIIVSSARFSRCRSCGWPLEEIRRATDHDIEREIDAALAERLAEEGW